MRGMNYDIKRGKDKIYIGIRLIIKKMNYIDQIVQVCPIRLIPGDTLSVSWDLTIYGLVNGKVTSELPIKFKFERGFDAPITVEYIRLTVLDTRKKRAAIQLYSEMPDDIYKPPEWNAKEVNK